MDRVQMTIITIAAIIGLLCGAVYLAEHLPAHHLTVFSLG